MVLRCILFFVVMGECLLGHDLITTKLTWSREISRIVYKRCASCHGGSASVPLLTFDQARPWAKAIKEEVLNRRMPPWGAVKGYGNFRNDASLSQEEVGRIAEWVEGGAPEGDPAYLPPPPAPPNPAPSPAVIPSRTLVLTGPIRLAGIRPLTSVAEAKVTAHKPDGSVEPLLWLRAYKREWNRTFLYREPVSLPRGTRIIADPPFPLELSLFRNK